MSWPLVSIGDVCTLMTGGTPKTTVPEYYDGAVPWIVSGDIHKEEIFECEKRINELAVDNSNARYLPRDSVLIALNGQGKTRGTVALLRMDRATCNQSIVSINPNNKQELSPDYLFYYLKSQYRQIRNLTGDKVRAGLNMPLIRKIKLPIPPFKTQKQIVAILKKADQLRKDCKQMERELNNLAQSVFMDMFGDVVSTVSSKNMVKMRDICSIEAKLVDPQIPENLNKPHIGPEHIEKYSGKILDHRTASEDGLISGKYEFKKGNVLFSKIRPNLKKVAIASFDGLCSADMYPLTPIDGRATSGFIWALLLSPVFHGYLSTLSSRANIPKINRKELFEFSFNLPPFEDQLLFSDVLKNLEDKKAGNEALANECEAGYLALMTRAFAGELYIKNKVA